MRKIILSIALCIFSCTLFAQQSDSLKNQATHLATYRQALLYDDLGTAATALTGYLMQGGTANFKDTLAIVYYRQGNLGGAYRLAGEINKIDPKDLTALTLLADISGRAGETKTSLEHYEKLTALQPNPYNHYQMATRQFMLERTGECKQSLEKVIADTAAARKEMVAMEIQQGQSENVPVLAAAYNMQGVLAFKEKNVAEAKRLYSLALAAHPSFAIARQNLEATKPTAPAPKTSAKPQAKAKN